MDKNSLDNDSSMDGETEWIDIDERIQQDELLALDSTQLPPLPKHLACNDNPLSPARNNKKKKLNQQTKDSGYRSTSSTSSDDDFNPSPHHFPKLRNDKKIGNPPPINNSHAHQLDVNDPSTSTKKKQRNNKNRKKKKKKKSQSNRANTQAVSSSLSRSQNNQRNGSNLSSRNLLKPAPASSITEGGRRDSTSVTALPYCCSLHEQCQFHCPSCHDHLSLRQTSTMDPDEMKERMLLNKLARYELIIDHHHREMDFLHSRIQSLRRKQWRDKNPIQDSSNSQTSVDDINETLYDSVSVKDIKRSNRTDSIDPCQSNLKHWLVAPVQNNDDPQVENDNSDGDYGEQRSHSSAHVDDDESSFMKSENDFEPAIRIEYKGAPLLPLPSRPGRAFMTGSKVSFSTTAKVHPVPAQGKQRSTRNFLSGLAYKRRKTRVQLPLTDKDHIRLQLMKLDCPPPPNPLDNLIRLFQLNPLPQETPVPQPNEEELAKEREEKTSQHGISFFVMQQTRLLP